MGNEQWRSFYTFKTFSFAQNFHEYSFLNKIITFHHLMHPTRNLSLFKLSTVSSLSYNFLNGEWSKIEKLANIIKLLWSANPGVITVSNFIIMYTFHFFQWRKKNEYIPTFPTAINLTTLLKMLHSLHSSLQCEIWECFGRERTSFFFNNSHQVHYTPTQKL